MVDTFEWQLDAIFRPGRYENEPRFALVVLNQPIENTDVLRELWEGSCLRVAADGGANRLYELSKTLDPSLSAPLDVIIGDLDSLTPQSRSHFSSPPTTEIIHDPDQQSTDFGKAINHVRRVLPPRGPGSPDSPAAAAAAAVDIAALGGIGGRVDQGLSQLHHLFHFQPGPDYAAGRVFLVSEESATVVLKAGRHVIRLGPGGGTTGDDGVFGKYVGILPVREASVITTRGLEWDVVDWETEFGGNMSTSNHVLPGVETVEVETSRAVLFTISLR